MKSWREFAIVLAVCALMAWWWQPATQEAQPPTELTEPRDITQNLPAPQKELVLVYFQPEDQELVEWSAQQIEAWTGATVAKITRLDDLPASYDDGRTQYDADKLSGDLSSLTLQPNQVVLAITSVDTFLSSKPEWRYCFGTRGRNGAVLSSARMGPRFNGQLPTVESKERYRKMLLRYVLELVYQVPRNDDPGSLLYRSVLAPRDLTTMEYRI
jgi:predicted Zn-dependent protease